MFQRIRSFMKCVPKNCMIYKLITPNVGLIYATEYFFKPLFILVNFTILDTFQSPFVILSLFPFKTPQWGRETLTETLKRGNVYSHGSYTFISPRHEITQISYTNKICFTLAYLKVFNVNCDFENVLTISLIFMNFHKHVWHHLKKKKGMEFDVLCSANRNRTTTMVWYQQNGKRNHV